MAIIRQCIKCKEVGKKMYCNQCEKSVDYFQVFEDVFGDNHDKISTLIHVIKAYTWNDTIKFVKDEYFKDQDDLVIECEKEFTYIERHANSDIHLTNPFNQKKRYKIFLSNENDVNFHKNQNASNMVIDLTLQK